MKTFFYPRLALSGIRKNGKLYFPYILSGSGMVMMFYILSAMSYSAAFEEMKGGSSIGVILSLGKFVIAVFAPLFLFYTNSFIVKKRYKEFGLFNILGMDKRKISRVIFYESLAVAVIDMALGIFTGIIFSKLAELGLINAVNKDINYSFIVPAKAVINTFYIFSVIFVFLLIKSLWQVRRCNPLELLKSENTGEKPPKANFVLAIIGAVLLGAAYYISVSIKSPLSALNTFFIAVIMVIAATYMLFTAGSVALCKILQKKKSYYKKENFISVSSMAYRMKRNGAGLASICILSTMVLVIISSTSSLYFGKNEALKARFPRDNELSVNVETLDNFGDDKIQLLKNGYYEVFGKYGAMPYDVNEYRCVYLSGMLKDSTVKIDVDDTVLTVDYESLRGIYIISEEDYNRACNKALNLNSGEAVIHPLRCTYKNNTLSVGNVTLNIVGNTDDFIEIGEANSLIFPSFMMVIKDYSELLPLEQQYGELLNYNYYFGYNLDAPSETVANIFNDVRDTLGKQSFLSENGYSFSSGCIELERDDFYVTFGGMFFLGIVLSAVFLFAATLIIYYKQLSEGYEDKARFGIMRKVGMTKTDIKKSVNKQVVTVFFTPLLLAGLHLAFAFPLVWKMLKLFNMNNLKYVIIVTLAAYLIFALFYLIIYAFTAKAYYSIVSEQ